MPSNGKIVRPVLVLIHRWVGLFTAGFLFITGLTGAVISWDHELDEWLNPHLIHAPDSSVQDSARPFDPVIGAQQIERRHPQVQVTYFPLESEPGHSLAYWVEPRFDRAAGRFHEVDFNQVFLDPVTGSELGKRQWGAAWPLSRENFVSFLYKLHYSLHIPEMYGIDHWGVWLLGLVALLWTLDCFVGAYLTLPKRAPHDPESGTISAQSRSYAARFWPSFLVRARAGAYKLNFDLHRAGGLWTWGLLFVLGFTAFSMNLYDEVFEPIMTKISDATPSIWSSREPRPQHEMAPPRLSFAQIVERAPKEATRRGWSEPPGHVFYSREVNIYEIAYFAPEDGHGVGGVGHKEVYFDGQDGHVLGDFRPWQGTAADLFVQAQFPVHSGRILGLPGRILISVMGLVVAGLSATGVYIWYKKRVSRMRAHRARLLRAASGQIASSEGALGRQAVADFGA